MFTWRFCVCVCLYRTAEAVKVQSRSWEPFLIRSIVRLPPGSEPAKGNPHWESVDHSNGETLRSTFDKGDADWWAGSPSTALTLGTRWAIEKTFLKKRKGYSAHPHRFNQGYVKHGIIAQILNHLEVRCVKEITPKCIWSLLIFWSYLPDVKWRRFGSIRLRCWRVLHPTKLSRTGYASRPSGPAGPNCDQRFSPIAVPSLDVISGRPLSERESGIIALLGRISKG